MPFAISWTMAHQAPLSMEFSRQECQSGLPFPSPGDLSNPVIKPCSPALQVYSLPSEPAGKLFSNFTHHSYYINNFQLQKSPHSISVMYLHVLFHLPRMPSFKSQLKYSPPCEKFFEMVIFLLEYSILAWS